MSKSDESRLSGATVVPQESEKVAEWSVSTAFQALPEELKRLVVVAIVILGPLLFVLLLSWLGLVAPQPNSSPKEKAWQQEQRFQNELREEMQKRYRDGELPYRTY